MFTWKFESTNRLLSMSDLTLVFLHKCPPCSDVTARSLESRIASHQIPVRCPRPPCLVVTHAWKAMSANNILEMLTRPNCAC